MEFMSNVVENKLLEFKYMQLIALIYMTLLLASTVCAYKIVQIGLVPEPGSTLIYTFSFFWGNIYAEIYGSTRSKKLIWESVICGYIFAILLTLINWLPSPVYWNNQNSYEKIFGHTLRFTTAGTIGYLCSAFLNVYLLTKWKLRMKGKMFWLRSLLSSTISDGFATFIAGIITFFGMMPLDKILFVMSSALLFKIFYGLIAIWPASFIAFILKKKEGILNEKLNVNPLNFHSKELTN